LSRSYCAIFAAASLGWITQFVFLVPQRATNDHTYPVGSKELFIYALTASMPAGFFLGLASARRRQGIGARSRRFALVGIAAGLVAGLAMIALIWNSADPLWPITLILLIGALIACAGAAAILGASTRQESVLRTPDAAPVR
jgi:hypothetical protein